VGLVVADVAVREPHGRSVAAPWREAPQPGANGCADPVVVGDDLDRHPVDVVRAAAHAGIR
jgi:hypothetical protein